MHLLFRQEWSYSILKKPQPMSKGTSLNGFIGLSPVATCTARLEDWTSSDPFPSDGKPYRRTTTAKQGPALPSLPSLHHGDLEGYYDQWCQNRDVWQGCILQSQICHTVLQAICMYNQCNLFCIPLPKGQMNWSPKHICSTQLYLTFSNCLKLLKNECRTFYLVNLYS